MAAFCKHTHLEKVFSLHFKTNFEPWEGARGVKQPEGREGEIKKKKKKKKKIEFFPSFCLSPGEKALNSHDLFRKGGADVIFVKKKEK